jgi:hypothetical protein
MLTLQSRPHTLSAMQLYLAHIGPFLVQASQRYQERLKKVEADNMERHERVRQQRKEIESTLQDLETMVSRLDTTSSVLNPEETDALRDEAREIDEGLRA